jgi:flagellar motor switch protein FliG
MNYDRSERIRRAAILVASLEEALAEQMLDNLPRVEAARIRDEVDRLGDVDPEEQQDVLEEFRRAGRRGREADDAVQFTYSAPQPVAANSAPNAARAVPSGRGAAPVEAPSEQTDADSMLMAELLAAEHPQTIAAALARLGHEQGAAVFAALPPMLQAEVLDRLANLQSPDEGAVQELEVQLQRRVDEHRTRREQAAAGAELARRIVAKTTHSQQVALLARLSPADAPASSQTKKTEEANSSSSQTRLLALAMRRPAAFEATTFSEGPSSEFEVWTDEAVASDSSDSSLELVDRSTELESLDDRTLLEALRRADEQTVHLALAASSEKFLQRIAGKLRRRQAARLRKVVRSLGPIRLAELRQAQHKFLEIACECQTASVKAR